MRQGAQEQGKQNLAQPQQHQTTGQGQAGQAPKQPEQLNQPQSQPKQSGTNERSQSSAQGARERSQTTGQGMREQNQATGQSSNERNRTTGQAQQPSGQAQQRTGQTQPSHAQSPQTQGQSLRNEPNQAQSRQGAQTGGTVNLTPEQRTRIQQTVLASRDVPRIDRINFSLAVGTVVPTTVRIVEVPETLIEIHPEWRGDMYFVVRDEIIIVDHSHRIVAIVPVGSSSAQLGTSERGSVAVGSGMSVQDIRQVQIMLIQKGFNVGEPDGVLGPRTREALIVFQRQQGFEATGQLDSRTMTALGVSGGRQQGTSTTGSQPSTMGSQPSTMGSHPSATNPSAAAPSTATPSAGTPVPSTAGQGGSNNLQHSPTTGSGAPQTGTGAAPHSQSMTPNTGASAPSAPSTSGPGR
jgi:hypothetical protein